MNRAQNKRFLARALGVATAVLCLVGAGVCVALGAPGSFLLVYLIGIMLGLVGALVATKEPRNSIGWLMIANGAVAGLIQLPGGYAYFALGINRGAWPLGSLAAWLGSWLWVISVGFLSLIVVRFPDGRARDRWRVVDWLYVVGTALFALSIALSPTPAIVNFLPIPGTKIGAFIPYFHNPIRLTVPTQPLNQAQGLGLTLVLLANVVAAASLFDRYRRATGDERLQIKWFAYACGLCAAALVYAGIAWNFLGQPLYLALTPLEFAGLALLIAIGIAILRYRLYDIDLIINRTLVYGSLTAILTALYTALTVLLNRMFVALTGQKSDAAYVITTFAVVVAFSPLRDWLQQQVNRRVRHASPASVLDQFRTQVDSVVSVIDVHRVARRLLDQAIEAFDARGAELYLDSSDPSSPIYARGHLSGGVEIEVPLRYEERMLGRLVLGSRRGNVAYTTQDRLVLQRSADSVGEALALAAHLGFRPLTKED